MSKTKNLSQADLKSFTRTFLQCGDHLHTLCRLEINSRLVKYSQWLILDCLTQDPVDNPSKVASQLGMEWPTVSHSLDILESRDLVSRTHNLADRRVVEIQVTTQGKKIAQLGVQRLEQAVQAIVEGIGSTRISDTLSTLDSIHENLNHKICLSTNLMI